MLGKSTVYPSTVLISMRPHQLRSGVGNSIVRWIGLKSVMSDLVGSKA